MALTKIKLDILSAGLGNVYRGFEISATVWHHELLKSKNLRTRLLSGGSVKASKSVFCIGRTSKWSQFLKRLKLLNDGVKLEQFSFALGVAMVYLINKPDVVWTQEITVARTLKKIRKTLGLDFKIIFCDGAPVGYANAGQFDALVVLHEAAYLEALSKGADPEFTICIPHLCLSPELSLSKTEARAQLGLPLDKTIVLSVAAWNRNHKRIDYILEEARSFEDEYVFLFCGQPEKESDELKQFAADHHIPAIWKTYSQQELSIAYQAADIFVLASLNEGLGAVLIEAGLHGLPIICHPHDGGVFVLGASYSGLTDLSTPGRLQTHLRYFETLDRKQLGDATREAVASKFDKAKWKHTFESFVLKIYGN